MLRKLRALLLAALAAVVLAGCMGWAQGPGPRHGRWDNPGATRYQCTDPQTGGAGAPCPYRQ